MLFLLFRFRAIDIFGNAYFLFCYLVKLLDLELFKRLLVSVRLLIGLILILQVLVSGVAEMDLRHLLILHLRLIWLVVRFVLVVVLHLLGVS